MGYPGPVINSHVLGELVIWLEVGSDSTLVVLWMHGSNHQRCGRCRRLGVYEGGRMRLWVSAPAWAERRIADGLLQPIDVAPDVQGRQNLRRVFGLRGLKRSGKKRWRRHVTEIVTALKDALEADYVVLVRR